MDINNYVHNNRLKVRVKPNARKTEILGYNKERDAVEIVLKAIPDKGEANKELLKFLTKLLKKKVTIKSGTKSRDKIILIK
jgi:uncharacterized protein